VAAYRLTFDNFLSNFIKLGSPPHHSVEEWGQLGQGLSTGSATAALDPPLYCLQSLRHTWLHFSLNDKHTISQTATPSMTKSFIGQNKLTHVRSAKDTFILDISSINLINRLMIAVCQLILIANRQVKLTNQNMGFQAEVKKYTATVVKAIRLLLVDDWNKNIYTHYLAKRPVAWTSIKSRVIALNVRLPT